VLAAPLAEDDGVNVPRLKTFGEFEERFKSAASTGSEDEKALGVFANALFDFTPSARPVYWRLLAIQAALYRSLHELSFGLELPLNIEGVIGSLDFDHNLPQQFDVDGAESVDLVADVVNRYIAGYVTPTLRRTVDCLRNNARNSRPCIHMRCPARTSHASGPQVGRRATIGSSDTKYPAGRAVIHGRARRRGRRDLATSRKSPQGIVEPHRVGTGCGP
jgi:hypothetical protein